MNNDENLPTGRDRFHARWTVIAAILGAITGASVQYAVNRDVTDARLLDLGNELAQERSRSDRLELQLQEMQSQSSEHRQPRGTLAEQVDTTSVARPPREVVATPISQSPPVEPVEVQAAPSAPQEPIREVTTQDFKFKLSGCARSSSNVTCEFLVTDSVGDRNFYIDSAQITDSQGKVYEAARFHLGAESGPFLVNSTLPAGIATKAALDFKSVGPNISLIKILELKGHTRDRARSRVAVHFPEILIQ